MTTPSPSGRSVRVVIGGHRYFARKVMAKVVKLPVPIARTTDEHARADTERNRRLFAWAHAVLKKLGVDKAVTAARSIEELHGVTFDADTVEVILAIRDALHPASGR